MLSTISCSRKKSYRIFIPRGFKEELNNMINLGFGIIEIYCSTKTSIVSLIPYYLFQETELERYLTEDRQEYLLQNITTWQKQEILEESQLDQKSKRQLEAGAALSPFIDLDIYSSAIEDHNIGTDTGLFLENNYILPVNLPEDLDTNTDKSSCLVTDIEHAVTSSTFYDPRCRDWYKEAVKESESGEVKVSFYGPYEDFATKRLILSFSIVARL